MSWVGYYEVDGIEVINTSRFEAYAKDASWFRPVYRAADLGPLLDETYLNPAADLAPWYDDDVPESADFFGVYPISITGMEDSTAAATFTESLRVGGVPGTVHLGVKQVVFSVILGAASEAGADYGLKWLKRVLLGNTNDTRVYGLGYEVRYFSQHPVMEDVAVRDLVLSQISKTRRRASLTSPPSRTAARDGMDCGGSVWTAQFTLTFGDPFEYGYTRTILVDPYGDDPPFPAGIVGTIEDEHDYDNENCDLPLWLPLSDPACPAIVTPPTPPTIPLGCWTNPTTWLRTVIRFDEGLFPDWIDMVPIVSVTNLDGAPVRGIRMRWYADDPDGFDPDSDPCGWITDMVVSYLPAVTTMRIDPTDQSVLAASNTSIRRADSVVFDSDGEPLTWPVLSGGTGYILALDLPKPWGASRPQIGVDLVARSA